MLLHANPASQSTHLYQKCSSLRSRLLHVRGLFYYFKLLMILERTHESTDPVTELWELFCLGVSLCYIFDQLPAEEGFPKINNSEFNQEDVANHERSEKHAIALFVMQISMAKVKKSIPGCEPFTVTELWNRNSIDGLIKVVNTVTVILDHLPPNAFDLFSPLSPNLRSSLAGEGTGLISPLNGEEAQRNNIIQEILETERNYVHDLEVMRDYSKALSRANFVNQDIHILFPNIDKILNFQRRFLIRFESTAELPWRNQRWGLHFVECEEEFAVYDVYWANYLHALELPLVTQNLSALDNFDSIKVDLQALLIKPIHRVCNYPLLLDSLINVTSPVGYPHYSELKRGSDTAKRFTNKLKEAQRKAENEIAVKNLRSRIDDWKGHHLDRFGELLLNDIFVVSKSEINRTYHVFLFEKIILCCKEKFSVPPNGQRKVRNSFLLKKQPTSQPPVLPGNGGQSDKKMIPLLLKARIFLSHVTEATVVSPSMSSESTSPTNYALVMWWKGFDEPEEFFTLNCRRKAQMLQWEAAINRLITKRRSAMSMAPEREVTPAYNKEFAQQQLLAALGMALERVDPPNPAIPQSSSAMPCSTYTNQSSTAIGACGCPDSGEQVGKSNLTTHEANPQEYHPQDDDEDGYEDCVPSTRFESQTERTNGPITPPSSPNDPISVNTVLPHNVSASSLDSNLIPLSRPLFSWKQAEQLNDNVFGPCDSNGGASPPTTYEPTRLSWHGSHLGEHQGELAAIVNQLISIFKDTTRYKRLLDCQEPQAQMLLDFFHSLSDHPKLDAYLRRSLVVAMQRLSRKTDLYPKRFVLEDVTLVDTEPVTDGGFADIYKGTCKGQVVCLKTIRVSQAEYFVKRFSHEAILWGQLSHPNLLPFYGLYQFQARACLVSPWVENGHINQFLKRNPNVDRLLLVRDIVEGIQYLHTENIIHGDLKGANILVDPSGRACLADFGLSAVTDSQIVHWTSYSSAGSKGGSVRWQAPELNDPECDKVVHNSKESDVYALSCVCYEIFTGCLPFHEFLRDSTVMFKVSNGHRPSRPLATSSAWTDWGLTEAIWDLMEDCWSHSPQDRPVVVQIITWLDSALTEQADDRPRGGWGTDMSPSYFRRVVSGSQYHLSVDDVAAILSEFA